MSKSMPHFEARLAEASPSEATQLQTDYDRLNKALEHLDRNIRGGWLSDANANVGGGRNKVSTATRRSSALLISLVLSVLLLLLLLVWLRSSSGLPGCRVQCLVEQPENRQRCVEWCTMNKKSGFEWGD